MPGGKRISALFSLVALAMAAASCGDRNLEPEVEHVTAVSASSICVERTNGLWMAEELRCFPTALYDGDTKLHPGRCLMVERALESARTLAARDAACPAPPPFTTQPQPD